MTPYEPPRQKVRGQLVDAATILVLIFATLFATTYLTQTEEVEAGAEAGASQVRPLAELPITDTEQAQFQKMINSGAVDLGTVNSSVEANQAGADKYEISVVALLGTAVLLAVYLAFVYRTSFREYREVIEEKFGPRDGGEVS